VRKAVKKTNNEEYAVKIINKETLKEDDLIGL